jgi:hypothetical protein
VSSDALQFAGTPRSAGQSVWLRQREWSCCDAVSQRLTLDQFEHERTHEASGFRWTFLQPVNRADVRMIE